MAGLTPDTILRTWEAGQGQHPIDRALTLLLAADPAKTRAALAELSVAERDRRLLDLRARTLGRALNVFGRCRECGGGVEFTLSTEALLASPPEERVWEAEVDGMTLGFRLPNSLDLAAAARCEDPAAARRLLAERCTVEGRDGSGSGAAAGTTLSEEAIELIAGRMAEVAPEAEVLFELSCPGCGAVWREGLDVADFFWRELAVQARRVLSEVHALARAYHWSERDILAMSPARRQSYLELVG